MGRKTTREAEHSLLPGTLASDAAKYALIACFLAAARRRRRTAVAARHTAAYWLCQFLTFNTLIKSSRIRFNPRTGAAPRRDGAPREIGARRGDNASYERYRS